MSFFKKILFVIVIVEGLYSQEAKPIKLSEFLSFVSMEHPKIQAGSARRLSNLDKIAAGYTAGPWVIDVYGGYKQAPENPGGIFRTMLNVPLKVPGYSGVKNKAMESAGEASLSDQKILRSEVILDATLSAIRLAQAEKLVEHSRERATHIKLIQSYLRSRGLASPEQRADRLIALSAISSLRNRMESYQADKDIFLAGVLRFVLAGQFTSIIVKKEDLPELLPLEASWQRVLEFNAELSAARLKLKYLSDEIDVQEWNLWASPSLSAFYEQEPSASTDMYFGAGISYPLGFTDSSTRKNISALSNEHKAVRLEIQNLEGVLLSKWKALQSSLVSIRKQRDQILSSSLSDWPIIISGFVKGQITLRAFIDAEEAMNGQEYEIIELNTRELEIIAAIAFLEGRLFTEINTYEK